MALKTRGIVVQVHQEDTFNAGATFSDSDVIVFNEFGANPKEDKVDRKQISCDLVKKAGVPVRATVDGNAALEVVPVTNGDDQDLAAYTLWNAGMGWRNPPGHAGDSSDNGKGGFVGKDHAGNDSNQVSLADSDTKGTDVVYTLLKGNTGTEYVASVAFKKFYDASNVELYAKGVVVNKVDIAAGTADIVTATFGLEGASYTTPTGDTKPACANLDTLPFIGKSATFTYDDSTVNAMDVSFSVANKITNEEGITGSGYTDKIIVEKDVTGTFKVLFKDFSYLEAMKNATNHKLYLEITSGSNKFGVYFPQLKITDFSITDNSNMLIEAQITFTAETKADLNPTPQAMLVGIH